METISVKVEPLNTDDEGQVEAERERQQVEIKEEPDWRIENYSPDNLAGTCVKKKDCTCNTQASHICYEVNREIEQRSKSGIQFSWSKDHMVKIETDNVSGIRETTSLENDYTKKRLIQTEAVQVSPNRDIKKETDWENASTSKTATATPSLNVDKTVKVEKETDVYTVGKSTQLNQVPKSKDEANHIDRKNDSQATECPNYTVKDEIAENPLAGLYMGHVVKDELVVGPEVLQKPNILQHQVAAINQVRCNTVFDRCFVRLENMHVDKENGACRIGHNTYKLRLPSRQDKQNINGSTLQNEQIINTEPISNQIPKEQEKPHKCDLCHFATAHKHRLAVHKRIHSDDKPYKCSLCNYASAYKAHLQIHEKTHVTNKPFKCDQCTYACVQKCDLLVHQRVHSGEKPYKCDYCVFGCNRKRDLLTHTRIHTGEKPHKCDHCDYACIRKRDLIAHTTTRHIVDQESGEIIHKCNHCSYSSPDKQSWMAHERTHAKEKPYKCKQCNYAVTERATLLSHIHKHAGERGERTEKRFKCSHCDYSSDHKHHMLVHQRKHSGEKPYKCSHCMYASATRRDLFVHEALHGGEKGHKCSRCSYVCGNVSHLRTHEKTHIAEDDNKPMEATEL